MTAAYRVHGRAMARLRQPGSRERAGAGYQTGQQLYPGFQETTRHVAASGNAAVTPLGRSLLHWPFRLLPEDSAHVHCCPGVMYCAGKVAVLCPTSVPAWL